MRSIEDLSLCLAHRVLNAPEQWLGRCSPSCLEAFLAGASMRASLTHSEIPEWRIHGPLEEPSFYLPLVARTGSPRLSVRWATALELVHFSEEDAFTELAERFEHWFLKEPWDDTQTTERIKLRPDQHDEFWDQLAEKPGMYMGYQTGWMMRCFLTGMRDGGDWLGLPAMKELTRVMCELEQKSCESYGSKHGIFRVYDCDPWSLFRMVGLPRVANRPERIQHPSETVAGDQPIE